jgi:hypothetical protein
VKLHSPNFEKELRRKVRRTLKSSSELRREFRAARKFRKQYHLMILVRPLISLGLGGVVWQMWEKTGHISSGLAVISLWGFVFVFMHAQRLMASLYASSDLRSFALLPVRESTVFRWEVQKFFFGALWSLVDMFLAYAALALRADFSVMKWCAVFPLSVVTWVEVVALAALCVTYFPRMPYQLASSILMLTIFVLVMARDIVGSAVMTLIDSCAPSLNLILPTGWPVSLFKALLSEDAWSAVGFLVLTAIVVSSLSSSILRLGGNYQFVEQVIPEPPDLVPGGREGSSAAEAEYSDQPTRLGPTAIEEIIQTRKFLAEPDWHQLGYLEKAFWGWCSLRERALAEFVFPNGLALSKPWRNIFRNLALACLAALGVGLINHRAENWLFGAGLFITVCQALGRLLTNGRAFQLAHCGGVNIPLYANYPIGFLELGAFFFKYSLTQLPLILLFSIVSCVLIFHLNGWPLTLGAWSGVKAAGLLLASRFVFLTFSVSSGTNDTSRIRVRSILLVLLAAFFGLGFAGLGAASLLLPDQVAAGLCWATAALEAYAFFRIYGWFYHRNQFDLMSLPRQ